MYMYMCMCALCVLVGSDIHSITQEPMLSPVDPQFFSRLGQDVKTELKRDKELERKVNGRQQAQV